MEQSEVESKLIGSGQLMDLVIDDLDCRAPFSVISVGVTEAFAMAQYHILKEEDFLRHKEVWVAQQGQQRGFDHRGIRFPNTEARDMAIAAVRLADAVGYNLFLIEDDLTREVFRYFELTPQYIFESHIRRVIMFSQEEKFKQMLAKRRLAIACSYADEVKAALERKWGEELGFEVTGAISIAEFEDIPQVRTDLAKLDFDLCLIAAGINAVILAPYIAREYGKVAFDLGLGMESLISGKVEYVPYLQRYIRLEDLMDL